MDLYSHTTHPRGISDHRRQDVQDTGKKMTWVPWVHYMDEVMHVNGMIGDWQRRIARPGGCIFWFVDVYEYILLGWYLWD